MAFAEEKFLLPTAGRLPDIPKEVLLRNMTTADEKMLLGSSDEAFSDIISSCVLSEDFKWESITSADQFFLLIKIRIISYGPDYYFTYRCPYCGEVHEYQTNLDELEVYYLDSDFKEPYDVFELPLSKDEIALKLPRLKDLNDNRLKVKRYNRKFPEAKGDISLIYGMMSNIATVNGEVKAGTEFMRYIEDLPAGDSSFIRNRVSRLKLGVDPEIQKVCKNPRCKEDLAIPLRVGSEFFHTRDGQ